MNKPYKNRWLEFNPRISGFRMIYSLASYFDKRHMISFCLGWGSIYIHLPWKSGIEDCEYPEYGIYWYGEHGHNSIWICWGMKKRAIYMPWSLQWVRTSVLRFDGKWEHERRGDKKDFWEDKWKSIVWNETLPYKYVLISGEIQLRLATIKVEEREWRWRLFTWLPLTKKVRRTIDVSFNDEVGERTGSWKGGTIGCGYEMLPNEQPIETLRRMEKDRKFN